ncbi:hypothetical protein [Actinomadura sp. 3N407]|uniref:hypothetical protein n=1 Tax=Actinomadura sp. 3N407 TaxID=3457423 RepID=UPI003FCC8697
MAANYDHTETIAAYTGPDGALYEIDHLGIRFPEQAGTYAVYRDGEMVAEFVPSLTETVLPEAFTRAELIELAIGALEGQG